MATRSKTSGSSSDDGDNDPPKFVQDKKDNKPGGGMMPGPEEIVRLNQATIGKTAKLADVAKTVNVEVKKTR